MLRRARTLPRRLKCRQAYATLGEWTLTQGDGYRAGIELVGTQRKFDEAISEFQAALAIVPGMQDALFSLGWTYALQGNDEEAKRYLDKYVMMAGTDAPDHYVKAARDRLAELRTESP
jgi:tetratricopeptide (TPR) repeat protein